eukprot:TRINITY_DN9835_c0_g1_i1.p1 TRINITY_DN9835_c0_g1~~TRINITY_DN9835_c0_g1_i1.p1  ORF type:complete len:234 (+),score=43.99 TRINITY_DN9835_c0_g1_i1:75-776(+)
MADTEEIFEELVSKYADRRVISLHRAVFQNDAVRVVELLDQGVPIDSTLLPLHARDQLEEEEWMVEDLNLPLILEPYEEPDHEAPSELGPSPMAPETELEALFYTPLLRACEHCSPAMVRLLLDRGANLGYRAPDGHTAPMCTLGRSYFDNEIVAVMRLVASSNNVATDTQIVEEVLSLPDIPISSLLPIVQLLIELGAPLSEDTITGLQENPAVYEEEYGEEITALLTSKLP